MVNAFEFAPAEGEFDFDIDSSLGVVGEFFVNIYTVVVLGESEFIAIEVDALFLPVFEPLHTFVLVAEELHFHLGEFA